MKRFSKITPLWPASLWFVMMGLLLTVEQWWFILPLEARTVSLTALFALCILLILRADLKTWGNMFLDPNWGERGNLSKEELLSIVDTIKRNRNFKLTLVFLSVMGMTFWVTATIFTPIFKSPETIQMLFVGWLLFSYVLQLQIRNHLLCKVIAQQSKTKLEKEAQIAQKMQTVPSPAPQPDEAQIRKQVA